MKFFIKVKPGSRECGIEKFGDNKFIVSVKEPPIKGFANKAVLKALASYFNVSSDKLKIISGFTSRNKIVELL